MAGRQIALLIGNGRFGSNSGFTPLRCPERDVSALASLLADESHGSFEVQSLIDRDQRGIQTALSETLRKAAGWDDLVLIYYSGHGSPDEDGSLFLAASDSVKADCPLQLSRWNS